MATLADFPRSFQWSETSVNPPARNLGRQGWIPGVPACQHEDFNAHLSRVSALNQRTAASTALDFRKVGTYASTNNALAGVLSSHLGPVLVKGSQATPLIPYAFSSTPRLGDATHTLSTTVFALSYPNSVLSGGASDTHIYAQSTGSFKIQIRQANAGEFRMFPRLDSGAGRYLSGLQGELEITGLGSTDLAIYNGTYQRFILASNAAYYSRLTTSAVTGQATVANSGTWASTARALVAGHVTRDGNTAIIFGKESDTTGTLAIRHSVNGGTSFVDWASVPVSGTDRLYARDIWYLDSTAKWYVLIRRSNASNVYQDHQIWSSPGVGSGWTLANSGYTGVQIDFASHGVVIGEQLVTAANTTSSGLQVWAYNARTNKRSVVMLDTGMLATNSTQRMHWANGKLVASVVLGTTLHVYQTPSFWAGWPIP
jgi:hypothetical protein